MNSSYIKANNFDNTLPLAVLPAAGYGTRMGLSGKEATAAKELFPHPLFKNYNFIEYTLELAQKIGCNSLVISRFDKVVLNEKLLEYQKKFKNLSILLIDPTPEWTTTVAQAIPYFSEKNILLLPDTVWEPIEIATNMLNSLSDKNRFSIGHFKITDPSLWGCIKIENGSIYLCEKPTNQKNLNAWGLIAFKKDAGEYFFTHYQKSSLDHSFIKLPSDFNTTLFELETFKDLTRPIVP